MNLFCLRCKKQPRHGHGQASGVPTLPIVPTPSVVPIARNTLDTSNTSHPVDSEVLAQGLAPITAEWVPYPANRYTLIDSDWSIIFVHGLRGHRRDTWTKDNVCWPQELLSKEESLSHTRILTLGYDANIMNLNGQASLNTLFQHSINLVQELSRVRKKDAVSQMRPS